MRLDPLCGSLRGPPGFLDPCVRSYDARVRACAGGRAELAELCAHSLNKKRYCKQYLFYGGRQFPIGCRHGYGDVNGETKEGLTLQILDPPPCLLSEGLREIRGIDPSIDALLLGT